MKLLLAVMTLGIVSSSLAGPPVNATRVPVLLELFTSEGCSSCPPADRILESLDRQPLPNADLIVMSEHVDYWNSLGWKDPYSSAAFSERQQKYSGLLGATVYTPQLVVDGQFQMVGSDQREIMQAIDKAAKEPKFPMAISASRSSVHVNANSGSAKADLYVAVAADRAESKVLKGENGGHTLTHVAVVKSFVKVGKWDTARDISIPTAPAGATRIIVFAQDPKTGKILAAAQTRSSGER